MQGEKPGRRFFVCVRAMTIESLGDLQKVWDLDVFRHTARELTGGIFEIRGLLTDAQIAEVRSRGYEVEVISDADEIARQRLKELRSRENE